MPIDIHVVIIGVNGAHQLSSITHLHSPTFINGTFLVFDNPLFDSPIVNGINISGLTTLRVNHRPDAATIAIGFTVFADDCEVTGGEIAHGTLHPCLYIKLRILQWHLIHLNGETRQHPRTLDSHQVLHAKTTGRGMEISGIQHVVSQMSHEKPSTEVTVERFCHKRIATDFIHVGSAFLLRMH